MNDFDELTKEEQDDCIELPWYKQFTPAGIALIVFYTVFLISIYFLVQHINNRF